MLCGNLLAREIQGHRSPGNREQVEEQNEASGGKILKSALFEGVPAVTSLPIG